MILEALIANAAILLGFTLILWVVAVQIDDASFIDSFWGFGMALMAFTSWMQLEAPGPLATLLMGMAVVWGLRLSIYLFLRWRREGEDKRYKRMLRKDREKGRFAVAALIKIFFGQAVLLFIVSSPAQYGVLEAATSIPISGLALVGLALYLLGIVFEWVGDWQLSRFKADPANEGEVMDTGLTRSRRRLSPMRTRASSCGLQIVGSSACCRRRALSRSNRAVRLATYSSTTSPQSRRRSTMPRPWVRAKYGSKERITASIAPNEPRPRSTRARSMAILSWSVKASPCAAARRIAACSIFAGLAASIPTATGRRCRPPRPMPHRQCGAGAGSI